MAARIPDPKYGEEHALAYLREGEPDAESVKTAASVAAELRAGYDHYRTHLID